MFTPLRKYDNIINSDCCLLFILTIIDDMFAIDLTTNNVIVATHQRDEIQLWSFLWTATFRESDDSLTISIGDEGTTTDEQTAVLHDLRDNIPKIYDHDVQVEVISQLLRQITQTARKNGDIEDPRTCVIVPYGYSSGILDAIEVSFQQSGSGLKLLNIINECVSAIVYFFENPERSFNLRPNPSGEPFCFINATSSPARAFLVDYREANNNRRFVVRDYYVDSESDNDQVFPKISAPGLKTVVFGKPDSVNPVGKVVDVMESQDKCRVMVAGAMLIGSGRFKSGRIYSIEGSTGFGIQIDSESFYEIIPKDLLMSNPVMPFARSKAFTIDNITHDVNINLYCGFSDKIAGSVNLGTITLMENWFPKKNGEIVVSVELDSMHSGKFSVHRPETIVKQFNVPGWLG